MGTPDPRLPKSLEIPPLPEQGETLEECYKTLLAWAVQAYTRQLMMTPFGHPINLAHRVTEAERLWLQRWAIVNDRTAEEFRRAVDAPAQLRSKTAG